MIISDYSGGLPSSVAVVARRSLLYLRNFPPILGIEGLRDTSNLLGTCHVSTDGGTVRNLDSRMEWLPWIGTNT